MKNSRYALVYAVGSAFLGVLAFVAAFVWRSSLQSSDTGASATESAGSVVSTILIFIGVLLIIFALIIFIVSVLLVRRRKLEDVESNKQANVVTQQQPLATNSPPLATQDNQPPRSIRK